MFIEQRFGSSIMARRRRERAISSSSKVWSVFLRGEEAKYEAELEREQMEKVLPIKHDPHVRDPDED